MKTDEMVVEVTDPHELPSYDRMRLMEEPEWEYDEFWDCNNTQIVEALMRTQHRILPCQVSASDPETWIFEF